MIDVVALQKEDEDFIVKLLEPLLRRKQIIALRYLRSLLAISIQDTGHELAKEYRLEQKAELKK